MTSKEKPIILLIGGLAMQASELIPLSDILARNNIESYVFDNLCVGTAGRPKTLEIKDQAEYQWKMVNEKNGNKKLFIFGISMGGMIASQMAAMQPDRINGLFLTATSANTGKPPVINDEIYSMWCKARTEEEIHKAVEVAFGKTCLKKSPSIKDKYANYRISGENKQSASDFMKQLNSIRSFDGAMVYSQLSKCLFPITVIAGEEDALFNTQHLNEIIRLCSRCNTELFKNTGHMIHLENLDGLAKIIITKINEFQS